MDTTTHGFVADSADPSNILLEQLATVDPADAPDVAEQLAIRLSAELDAPAGEGHR